MAMVTGAIAFKSPTLTDNMLSDGSEWYEVIDGIYIQSITSRIVITISNSNANDNGTYVSDMNIKSKRNSIS